MTPGGSVLDCEMKLEYTRLNLHSVALIFSSFFSFFFFRNLHTKQKASHPKSINVVAGVYSGAL